MGVRVSRNTHRIGLGFLKSLVVVAKLRVSATQFLIELSTRFRRPSYDAHDLEIFQLMVSPGMRASHVTSTNTKNTNLVTHDVAGTVTRPDRSGPDATETQTKLTPSRDHASSGAQTDPPPAHQS